MKTFLMKVSTSALSLWTPNIICSRIMQARAACLLCERTLGIVLGDVQYVQLFLLAIYVVTHTSVPWVISRCLKRWYSAEACTTVMPQRQRKTSDNKDVIHCLGDCPDRLKGQRDTQPSTHPHGPTQQFSVTHLFLNIYTHRTSTVVGIWKRNIPGNSTGVYHENCDFSQVVDGRGSAVGFTTFPT